VAKGLVRGKRPDYNVVDTDIAIWKINFQKWCRKNIEGNNSGLLYDKQVYELLNQKMDTSFFNAGDSIIKGKFYFDKSTVGDSVLDYVLCITAYDDFDYNILYHIQKKGYYSIVKDRALYHGNYTCFGDNLEGFGNVGGYYYWDQNSTGSGFCSSNRFFFDINLNFINKDMGIPIYMWSFWKEGIITMSSKMRCSKNNLLVFDYVLKDGMCPDAGCNYEEIPLNTKQISIKYQIKENALNCLILI